MSVIVAVVTPPPVTLAGDRLTVLTVASGCTVTVAVFVTPP